MRYRYCRAGDAGNCRSAICHFRPCRRRWYGSCHVNSRWPVARDRKCSQSHDLYYKIIDPKADTKTRLIVARVLLIVIGAAGALVASMKLTGILGAVAWAFCFANSGLFFPLVLGIWWKRANAAGAIAGMICGFAAGAAYLVYVQNGGDKILGLDGLRFGIIGMPVSLIAMVVVSLMTPEPDAETQAMVDEVRNPGGETILGSTH